MTGAGERRTLTLHYECLPASRAGRQVEHDMWAAEISADLRAKRGFRINRRDRRRAGETAAHKQQFAAGHTMVRVAAQDSGFVAACLPVGVGLTNKESRA